MGSILIAAGIARIAFVALVAIGLARGDLSYRAASIAIVVGIGAWLGLPLIPNGQGFVTSALAVLDVVLVLVVFKGDVRLG